MQGGTALPLGSGESVPRPFGGAPPFGASHHAEKTVEKNPLIQSIESFMRDNHPKVEIVGTAYLRKTNIILLRGRRPGNTGSVRFVVETENNCFVGCREITTSERKRLGKAAQKYRNTRGKKHAAK